MLRTGLLAVLCVSAVDGFNLGRHVSISNRRACKFLLDAYGLVRLYDGLMLDAHNNAEMLV